MREPFFISIRGNQSLSIFRFFHPFMKIIFNTILLHDDSLRPPSVMSSRSQVEHYSKVNLGSDK